MLLLVGCSKKLNREEVKAILAEVDSVKIATLSTDEKNFVKSLTEQITVGIETSDILRSGFSGLIVYDLDDEVVVYERNVDKYFVAASNTKLFTMYACIKILKDSIPALKYSETDSSFIFWGTADPTFLHPYFEDTTTLQFIKKKSINKNITFAENDQLSPYGQGWMWDDYNAYYQVEMSSFPAYGNILLVNKDTAGLYAQPLRFFQNSKTDSTIQIIKREQNQNLFNTPSELENFEEFYQEVPYKNATLENIKLLEDTLNRAISFQKLAYDSSTQTLYSWPADTVIRRMMQISDNMLSDHLLLSAGLEMLDTLSMGQTIKWANQNLFKDMPQKLVWVDGSGLSRYNRFTPASILHLLKKMNKEIPQAQLLSLMAVGGGNGTLSDLYLAKEQYVFGKTGSMTGVYNLSGYLLTEKGKKLAFSFLNNNFLGKASLAGKEVETILKMIRTQY
jgi:D-alanyl-D-alanine carboxypeptidase/D-alanyl-D-alanine-endopeptidase (penicillin-binding protein 4)